MCNIKPITEDQKLIIISIMLLFVIISSILTLSFSVFFIQVVLSFITIPFIIRRDYITAKSYLIIFCVSLCWIFLVYYANQMAYGFPYYIGGSDDLFFEQSGFIVAQNNVYNPSEIAKVVLDKLGRYTNAHFFHLYISMLINLASGFDGYNTYIPRIMNVYFLLWICLILRYLLEKYAGFSHKKSLISILIFSLTPNIQYINSHVFRDTFNLLLVFCIIYIFDKLIEDKNYYKKILELLLLILLIYISYYTRKNSLAFAGIICLFILLDRMRIKKRYILLLTGLLVIIVGLTDIVDFNRFYTVYSKYILNLASEGLSRYVFQPPLFPFGILLRSAYALISPFPNFFILFKKVSRILYDFAYFLIFVGTILQILSIPYIVKRIKKIDWLSLSFIVWFLAVITTTFTFRHVIFYYTFLVPMAVDGYFSTKPNLRKLFFIISSLSLIFLAMIYGVLKIM